MNENNIEKNCSEDAYNDCILKGNCSISPTLSSAQAVMIVYLHKLAFYLLELNKLGFNNEKIKQDFIIATALATTTIECDQENINKLVSTVYEDAFQAKELYKTICKNNNINPNILKSKLKLSQRYNINDVIIQAQKYFLELGISLEDKKKRKLDLMIVILKSICIYIMELQELNINIDDYYKSLLIAFGTVEPETISIPEIDEMIQKYVILDNELLNKVFEVKKEKFGKLVKSEVFTGIRPGKAILIAGANIEELELLLKATQDKGVDIYTHGQMIIGHAFENLKIYPHLMGHYGKGIEYALQDFMSFPGVIYLTKFSLHKLQNIYQRKIFTGDIIAPMGLTQIKDNDFEPLIRAALEEEGFEEFIEKENIEMNFKEEEYFEKINELAEKIEKNEIKNIFFIGVSNRMDKQKQYLDKFLNLLNDDDFAISFSYTNNRENVLHYNMDYAFPSVYKTLDILSKKKSISEIKPNILFLRCEPHTIPNLFYMKYIGINDIYFESCSPSFINPILVDSVKEILDLKNYTNPENDLKQMRKD